MSLVIFYENITQEAKFFNSVFICTVQNYKQINFDIFYYETWLTPNDFFVVTLWRMFYID